MSKYKFLPPYAYKYGREAFVNWHQALTPDQCAEIITVGESKKPHGATVNSENKKALSSVRRSNVSWLKEHDLPWLYPRIEYIAQQLNGQYYDYDLWGINEDVQYTVYTHNDKGFYTWHQDSFQTIKDNIDQRLPRKFSLTFQLSDPSEYEGGDLCIHDGNVKRAGKEIGLAVAFPSWTLHCVTPVTKGIRRSLVVWICGPKFK